LLKHFVCRREKGAVIYSNWRGLVLVVLALSTITCKKKKKVNYDDTQYTDVLVVVDNKYVPEFWWPYDELYGQNQHMRYEPPRYETDFEGELIQKFHSPRRQVYEITEIGDTVEVIFRKEANGGSRCKIDELRTSSGSVLTDVGDNCTLREEVRGAMTENVEAEPENVSAEAVGEMAGLSPDELDAALALLPAFLDNLNRMPRGMVLSTLDFLAEYLQDSPEIPVEVAEEFADILGRHLAGSPNIPVEYLERFRRIVADHSAIFPRVSAELQVGLSRYSKDGIEWLPQSRPRGYRLAPTLQWPLPLPGEVLRLHGARPVLRIDDKSVR
jgi:hypothetical protein